MEICFDNREADFGRFLRRHLLGPSGDAVRELVHALATGDASLGATSTGAESVLDFGDSRFQATVAARSLALPPHGSWELAATIRPALTSNAPTKQFLDRVLAQNPDLSGWPMWIDSRGFPEQLDHPYVYEGGWEALLLTDATLEVIHLDFWRIESSGQFYLRRGLYDDLVRGSRAKPFGSRLDFSVQVKWLAEALATLLALARGLDVAPGAELQVAARWTGIAGRELASWTEPLRHLVSGRRAAQNTITTFASLPADTSPAALSEPVSALVGPLFALFDGFELPRNALEELVIGRIQRRS